MMEPLNRNVIVKKIEAEKERVIGGIIIPENHIEIPNFATVISMGAEVKSNLKVGDKILYAKHTGMDFKADNNEEFMLLDEADIMAVMR